MGERPNQAIQEGDEATSCTQRLACHDESDLALKWCTYHKALHPLSAFSKAAVASDQLSWWCREGQREYRSQHRERYNAKDRERYHSGAARRSLLLAAKRQSRKTYRSKYNPLGLPPEERPA